MYFQEERAGHGGQRDTMLREELLELEMLLGELPPYVHDAAMAVVWRMLEKTRRAAYPPGTADDLE